MHRIYLSPPHLAGNEYEYIKDVLDSNWVAPLGPHVDAFESEFAQTVGVTSAAALSSGTAALHLALRILGVRPGEEVFCSTLTFSASANAIVYEGGAPVFIDSEEASWNMDPELLRRELKSCAQKNRLPRAVIAVDLYGQCADYEAIEALCSEYDVPLIEDAAEALGATYKGRPAGSFGKVAAFSFNGNKIITTSGGGMLVSQDPKIAEKARFLASQARDPAPHYEHSEIGFNYRMSNVLAAIGRCQLRVLKDRVQAKRHIFDYYREALGNLPGIEFMPETPAGMCNRWLTCLTIDPAKFGRSREDVRIALDRDNIDARPVWKPMHLQPVYSGCRVADSGVSKRIFELGLCLPSGSALSEEDLERICRIVRGAA
jgi:pyridoxal phosphate-dependent aminotransferase EpsN